MTLLLLGVIIKNISFVLVLTAAKMVYFVEGLGFTASEGLGVYRGSRRFRVIL